MKRKNKSRAAGEAVRLASDEIRPASAAQNSIDAYPGLVGIEIGVPYSRRYEPPCFSGHAVREGEEEEEDYDLCQ